MRIFLLSLLLMCGCWARPQGDSPESSDYFDEDETTTLAGVNDLKEEVTTISEEITTTTVAEEVTTVTTVPEKVTTVTEEATEIPVEVTTFTEEVTTISEEVTTLSEEDTSISEEVTEANEETTKLDTEVTTQEADGAIADVATTTETTNEVTEKTEQTISVDSVTEEDLAVATVKEEEEEVTEINIIQNTSEQVVRERRPQVTLRIQNQPQRTETFTQGNVFGLQCEATSKVDVDIDYFWTKNGRFVDLSGPRMFLESQKKGNLIILKPDSDDEGLYQCVASNSEGVVFSRVIKVESQHRLNSIARTPLRLGGGARALNFNTDLFVVLPTINGRFEPENIMIVNSEPYSGPE